MERKKTKNKHPKQNQTTKQSKAAPNPAVNPATPTSCSFRGQAGSLQPRAGPVGAASTRLVSFQRLFKPLASPQRAAEPHFCLPQVGRARRAGFPSALLQTLGVIKHLKTQTVTKLGSAPQAALDGLSPGSFLFIFLFTHRLLPREAERGREAFVERRVRVPRGRAASHRSRSIRPASLNPRIGLLGSASRAGNRPRKTHSVFPIVVLYIITILFYTHNQASFAVRGGTTTTKKKGISRHK